MSNACAPSTRRCVSSAPSRGWAHRPHRHRPAHRRRRERPERPTDARGVGLGLRDQCATAGIELGAAQSRACATNDDRDICSHSEERGQVDHEKGIASWRFHHSATSGRQSGLIRRATTTMAGTAAPASLSAYAADCDLAPVVNTSSSSSTRRPATPVVSSKAWRSGLRCAVSPGPLRSNCSSGPRLPAS